MDRKKNMRIFLAAAVCGIPAVGCVILCILLAVTQHVPSLQTLKAEQEEPRMEEILPHENKKEAVLADFTAGQDKGAAAQKEAEQDTQAEAQDEYLCPFSNTRLMTEEDIAALLAGKYEGFPEGKGILRMIINEIYARHGYQFGNEEILAYFQQKEWYQAIEPREDVDADGILAEMSEIERANIDFISMWENL